MDQRLKQIKIILQKIRNSWIGVLLLLTVVMLAAAIAISAGKLKNVFNPDIFIAEDQDESEFDPIGYGLQENDSQQGDEEGDRSQGDIDDRHRQRQTGDIHRETQGRG